LVKKNNSIFENFVNDGSMQGRTRAYFSMISSEVRKPKKIAGSPVYVETNLSANNIRNIIVNMLEKYNIPKNQYQIYLSKDLTPLHTSSATKVERTECEYDSEEEYHT